MDWCSSGLPLDFTMGHLAMSQMARWAFGDWWDGWAAHCLQRVFWLGGLYGTPWYYPVTAEMVSWVSGKHGFLMFLATSFQPTMLRWCVVQLSDGFLGPRVNGSISRYICLRLHANILDELAGNCQKGPQNYNFTRPSRSGCVFFSMTSHPE